jgi:branched-subunit amino acid aminotransferase/4-amino-4-deoxychorismate lyase
MHDFVCFDYKITSSKNSTLQTISPASFYGRGIFTTIAIYNSKPLLWEKHWLRLISNAEKITLDFTRFSEAEIKKSLFEIIAANKIINGRARLTFFDESSIPLWQTKQKKQTSFLINTAESRNVPKPLRLTISPFPTNSESPLSGIKTCNYLENIIALENAKAKGFDEAIRLNERGEIASACMANVFWMKKNEIFTPKLETGCLAGTTREYILENYSVLERQVKLDELIDCEAIFLSSAGIGMIQIAEFQERKFSGESHEITNILKTQN